VATHLPQIALGHKTGLLLHIDTDLYNTTLHLVVVVVVAVVEGG